MHTNRLALSQPVSFSFGLNLNPRRSAMSEKGSGDMWSTRQSQQLQITNGDEEAHDGQKSQNEKPNTLSKYALVT